MRTIAVAVSMLVLAVFAAGCGSDGDPATPGRAAEEAAGGDSAGRFDSARAFADLEAQVEIGARPARSPGAEETRTLIEQRLADAGIEFVGRQRPHENVIAHLEGEDPGYVVVGAHYDTKDIPGFVGANDAASGVAVLLELARTLPRPLPGPSVELVFFDAEEARGERPFEFDGARGSRQYIELAVGGGSQGSPPVEEIRAMVLFDLVGDCDLQIPLEGYSDAGLHELFADAARTVSGSPAPFEGEADPVLDDHIPFREAGIPAVDLIDFQFGPGERPGEWFHTDEDTLDKVCPESLDAVGEAALEAIPRIR